MVRTRIRSGGLGGLLLMVVTTGLNAYAWESGAKKASKSVNKEYIKQRVSEEIVTQLGSSKKSEPATVHSTKHRSYVPQTSESAQGGIYLLPNWPVYSLFFERTISSMFHSTSNMQIMPTKEKAEMKIYQS